MRMPVGKARWIAGGIAFVVIAAGAWRWSEHRPARFLPEDTSAFVAVFPPPPLEGSPEERRELDVLLDLQKNRTQADVAAAHADRRKDVDRFYAALGFDARHAPRLPALQSLMEDVEDDVSRYVRAPKRKFARSRPHVVDPTVEPCIGDVAGDRSYPSGHSTYGYVIAYLLAEMVPQRRAKLLARADEFARARAVCGVHFPSDLAAGRIGAEWLVQQLLASPDYRAAAAKAAPELRAALAELQGSGHSSARRAPPRLALASAIARPRCNAAIRATMASPRPKPPVSRLRLVSSRVNAWNTAAR